MANLRSSLLVTFVLSNGATAVQLLVTIVLARLLSPAEIGIYSITAVMVSMAHIFRDFGVASYLQREKELTSDMVGAAFGVLIISSWSIAVGVFFASGPVARFFGEPGVEAVMRVLSIGFIFIPFGSITHSLLIRDYRAKDQMLAYFLGTTAYAFTAVGLAYLGFGYMSMAWANLANIIATALGYAPFRPKIAPWLPHLRGWRKIVNFGAGAVLSNGLTTVNNALPDVLLGKLSGPYDVGIMSRSISTPNLLNQLIGPTLNYAVLPYLSKTHHSGQSLSIPMVRAVAYVTSVMWPSLAVIYIYAEPVILFLYGSKWLECVPLIQQVCLMLALVVPFSFNSAAYMAIGRPYLASLPTALDIAMKGLGVYFLYEGSLASFAWALVASSLLMYPVQTILQKRFLGLGSKAFILAQTRSFGISIVCVCVAWSVKQLTEDLNAFLEIIVISIIAPIAWLASLWCFDAPLKQEVVGILKRLPLISKFLSKT